MIAIVLDLETTVQKVGDDKDNSPYNPDNRCVSAHWLEIDPLGIPGAVSTLVFHHNEKPKPDSREALQAALDGADVLVAHNAKFDVSWLREMGFRLPQSVWCTMIGEYIFSRGQRAELSLEKTALRRRVSAKKSELIHDLFKGGTGFEAMPLDIVIEYAEADVKACAEVYLKQLDDLEGESNKGLKPVFDLMFDMLDFLVEIESNGVKIDLETLSDVEVEFRTEKDKIEKRLNEIVRDVMGDTPINLNSGIDMTRVVYSRRVHDRDLHQKMFNIGLNAAGKPLPPPRMKPTEFSAAVRATTEVVYRTVLHCCPVCKGSGKQRKFTKSGEPYKVQPRCMECGGGGALYVPDGRIAGLRLVPIGPADASINGFKVDKVTIRTLISQAEFKNRPVAVEFLTKMSRLNALNTYLDSFVKGIQQWTRHDSRLHANFNQTVAATGRLSSCVAEWTLIKTNRGLIPISEIRTGDKVWTHERRWKPVEGIVIKPVTPMADVFFSNGHVLTCTLAHRLLLKDGSWKTIEEIIDERIKVVDAEPFEHCQCSSSLSQRSTVDDRRSCEAAEDDTRKCLSCSAREYASQGIESTQGATVLHIQAGSEKPNAREVSGSSSKMDWGMLGLQRLPHDQDLREEDVRASVRDGRSIGVRGFTSASGRSSHRQRPDQQQSGQLGSGNEGWSQDDPFPSGHELFGEITAIHSRGPLQVWDITVADDHSYWAEGCFNHNTKPNFQNQPKGGKFPVRKCVVSRFEDGQILEADFSGLEFRVAGELSRDPQIIADITNGKDIHKQTASIIRQKPESEVTKEERQSAKSTTFSPLYGGMGANEAPHVQKYFQEFFQIYKGLAAYHKVLMDGVLKDGIVRIPSGREYMWPSAKRLRNGRITNATQVVNYPVQGFATGDIVPLACIRAVRAFRERQLRSKLILTVHDSIVVDVCPGEVTQVAEALSWAMKGVKEEILTRFGYEFILPLDIEIEAGKNWMEMHAVPLT